MALMSLRSRSHIKASMALIKADNLCIHNYIRSLLNSIYIIKCKTYFNVSRSFIYTHLSKITSKYYLNN